MQYFRMSQQQIAVLRSAFRRRPLRLFLRQYRLNSVCDDRTSILLRCKIQNYYIIDCFFSQPDFLV